MSRLLSFDLPAAKHVVQHGYDRLPSLLVKPTTCALLREGL
jgi:hypothetical protein